MRLGYNVNQSNTRLPGPVGNGLRPQEAIGREVDVRRRHALARQIQPIALERLCRLTLPELGPNWPSKCCGLGFKRHLASPTWPPNYLMARTRTGSSKEPVEMAAEILDRHRQSMPGDEGSANATDAVPATQDDLSSG